MKKILLYCLATFILAALPLYATDWYVRPAGGNFGAENGASYSNAWDGLNNVTWGSGGVQPGDTLWICGLHYHKLVTRTSLTSQGDIPVPSGTSEGARIVLRGDHPNDPGIVWGAYLIQHESWMPEGNNVYSITLPGDSYGGNIFEDVGNPTNSSYTLLSKKNSLAEVQGAPGSYFSPDYQTGTKLYVRCSDSGNPGGRILGDRYGYEFILDGKKYVTFKGLTIYHPLFHLNSNTTHIRWDSCTLMHGEDRLLTFRDGNHYMEVLNCELAYANTLIYNISNTNNAPSFYRYAGNILHHSAYLNYHQNHLDPHAMGIQGGDGGIVEDNYIYLCGDGFIFYTYAGQDFKNTTIRRNFIKDGHSNLGPPEGITFGCNNDSLSDKTGNKCYQNIVCGQFLGIKSKWEHEIEIFNNIVYNCDYNFLFKRNYLGHGPKLKIRNNISLSPRLYHIHFSSDATDFKLDSDHNLFYPDNGNLFYFYSHAHGGVYQVDLAGWKQISVPNFTFDPNSTATNPRLINGTGQFSSPTDFKLQSNSPAIDTGLDMGLTRDFAGTPLPQGYAPDKGAFEYISGANPLVANSAGSPTSGYTPLTVSFSGSASGGNAPYTYHWSFGDGGTSSNQNPSHTFAQSGNYTVTLTVTDNSSNQDADSISISVSAAASPLNASASASPNTGDAPLAVSFTGGAMGGASPYSYSWDFGDGGSSGQQNPTYTFDSAGSFLVTLTVTDSASTQDTAALSIDVTSTTHQVTPPNTPNSPSQGTPGVTYDYTTGGAACSQGHSVEYRFDWGDGTYSNWSSSDSASHAWSSPGTYAIKAQARCSVDTNMVSAWSNEKILLITDQDTYDLTLSVMTSVGDPAQGGTTTPAPGSYSYQNGDSVAVKAIPSSDEYRFSKWSGNVDGLESYLDEITILTDRDRDITANFYTQCGDVNGDAKISPMDSQHAFDIFLGRVKDPDMPQLENADVNCDGTATAPKVTPKDAHSIFKYYLGKKELPGDCSCKSRETTAATLSAGLTPALNRSISIDNIQTNPGATLVVPIVIDNPSDLVSFGFDLAFPAHLLSFVGIAQTELSLDFIQLDGAELMDGIVRVGGYRSDPIQSHSGGALVSVIFEVKGDAGGISPLLITNTVDNLKNARINPGIIQINADSDAPEKNVMRGDKGLRIK